MASSAIVEFEVIVHTQFGEEVRLVGSSPSLGHWNPHHGKTLVWNKGDRWTGSFDFPTQEFPFEYKYVIVRLEKKKKRENESTNEGVNPEEEFEVEEVTFEWEDTPNRPVKEVKCFRFFKDKWNRLPQTEAEIALEEKEHLLDDLKALESLIFPQFTYVPRPLGSKEFGIGIMGEPDKNNLKRFSKERERSFFMEGVLRKNSDSNYHLYWFGRQIFSQKISEGQKYDIYERFPLEEKFVTYVDRSCAVELFANSMIECEWKQTMKNVLEKLGDKSQWSDEIIFWDTVDKKWLFRKRQTPATSRFKRDIEDQTTNIEQLSPVHSVTLTSNDPSIGTTYFQYIPGTEDIIAVRNIINEEEAFAYITVYDSEGRCLMPEVYIAPIKFEGMILLYDFDAKNREPYLATTYLDLSDLRRREHEVRKKIDEAYKKCCVLKEKELES